MKILATEFHDWIELFKSCSSLSKAKSLHHEASLALHTVARSRHQKTYLSNVIVEMYGRCGSVDDARNAFDAIEQKDSFSLNILLRACIRNGCIREAQRAFECVPRPGVFACTTMVAAYAAIGHLGEARAAFDKIPCPDVVSWNAMLSCYARHGSFDGAKKCFDAMPNKDCVSFNTLLLSAATVGDALAAESIFWRMPCRSDFSFSSMVAAYAYAGRIEDSKRLFQQMLHAQIQPGDVVFNAFASSALLLQETEFIFRCSMQDKDVICWTTMVKALGQAGQIGQARRAFDLMPFWDLVSWTAMVTVYAHNGHSAKAKTVFDDMILRNEVSWISLVWGFAQEGYLEPAKTIFDRAPLHDVRSCNAILTAYARVGHVEEGKEFFGGLCRKANSGASWSTKTMFDQMLQRDIVSWACMLTTQSADLHQMEALFFRMPQWDLISWTSILTGYGKRGDTVRAKQMFDDVPEQSLVLWTSLLATYAQAGESIRALQLFQEMVQHGFAPDWVAFTCILVALSHDGDVKLGRSCFMSIASDFSLEPVRDHYCCMVDLLGRAGHLDDAEDLVHKMPFLPDSATWRTLLAACQKYQDTARGERVAKMATGADPGDSVPYVMLGNVYRDTTG